MSTGLGRLATSWVVALTLSGGVALAQEPKPAAAAEPASAPAAAPAATPPAKETTADSGFAQWNERSKKPFPWWTWGADLRLRDEYMDNTLTLSSKVDRHQQNYLRFRARWWNKLTPVRNVELNARLTFESRYWTETSFSSPFHTGWDWNEIVFDQLNVRIKDVAGQPLTLQVGRQDLSLGDRWLVFEGTPLDGSRTIYFDAARATAEIKRWKTTVDAIYIDQGARNDRWLPPIRISSDTIDGVEAPIKKAQIEHNEKGLILYLTNKSKAKAQIDGYFIYKGTRKEPIRVSKAEDAGTWTPFEVVTSDPDDAGMIKNLKGGEDSDLYTIGARVVGTPTSVLRYALEAAYQTGKRSEIDVRGLGATGVLSYVPKSKLNHQPRISFEWLSGDDPSTTDRDERFDTLWGRWPRWSELYIYTYAPELRISQISNIRRVGPGWTVKPFKNAELVTDFYWMFADQKTKKGGFFSEDGTSRGRLLTSKLLLKINAHVTAHAWTEILFPGDFYSAGVSGDAAQPSRRDTAAFLRGELNLTW